MVVLVVTSPSVHERRAAQDLFPDDTVFVTPGQAVAGRRFDTIIHTRAARQYLTDHSWGREWYGHLATRLNPGGIFQPLPEPEQ